MKKEKKQYNTSQLDAFSITRVSSWT